MEPVSLKALLEAGCHFGHKSERWHPKAAQFIYQEREGIHIIDLVKTKTALEKAAEFVKKLALEGSTVLFCGTKRQAAAVVKEEAARVGVPYISERWIGGFLTNWSQIHANLEKIRRLKEEETTGVWKKYPKHERVKLGRYVRKLEFFYGGVLELFEPPQAIFVVDIRREEVAVREAKRMELPVIAIVDTNSDPTGIDYPIPANDDAVGSIQYIVHYLAESYREGKEAREKLATKEAKKAKAPQAVTEKATATDTAKTKSQSLEAVKVEKAKVEVAESPPKQETIEKTEVVDVPKKKRGRPKKEKK